MPDAQRFRGCEGVYGEGLWDMPPCTRLRRQCKIWDRGGDSKYLQIATRVVVVIKKNEAVDVVATYALKVHV